MGETDQALDDALGLLHEIEADLLDLESVSGDPNYCEVFAKRVLVRYRCTMLRSVYAANCRFMMSYLSMCDGLQLLIIIIILKFI